VFKLSKEMIKSIHLPRVMSKLEIITLAVKLYEELYQSDPANPQYLNALYRVYTQLKIMQLLLTFLTRELSKAG